MTLCLWKQKLTYFDSLDDDSNCVLWFRGPTTNHITPNSQWGLIMTSTLSTLLTLMYGDWASYWTHISVAGDLRFHYAHVTSLYIKSDSVRNSKQKILSWRKAEWQKILWIPNGRCCDKLIRDKMSYEKNIVTRSGNVVKDSHRWHHFIPYRCPLPISSSLLFILSLLVLSTPSYGYDWFIICHQHIWITSYLV